jgi:hypothetical protein
LPGSPSRGELLAFIDESYEVGGVYYQGALVVTVDQALAIRRELDTIASELLEFGLAPDLEFHGAEIFQATSEWRKLREKPDHRVFVYRQVLRALEMIGGTYLFQGIDTQLHRAQYGERAHHPHQLSLQYLLERVNRIGLDSNRVITLIADKVPDQASHEAQMRRFQVEGTPGWNRSQYSRIGFPIVWRDSKEMRSLQAIDMATYMVRRHREHEEKHAKRAREVMNLYTLIMNQTSYIEVWPKRLKH